MQMFPKEPRRYVLCLMLLALAFTLLPLTLLLASSTEPCDPGDGSGDASVLASGNPFSHDNLCRIRERLGHLRRRDRPVNKVVTTGRAGEAAVQAAASPPPPAPLLPPPAPPSADFLSGGDIPDIEWPQTTEDMERVKKLPHVDTCYFCKVCIPKNVVGSDPLTLRRLLQQHDDGDAAAAAGDGSEEVFDFPDPEAYGWKPHPDEAGADGARHGPGSASWEGSEGDDDLDVEDGEEDLDGDFAQGGEEGEGGAPGSIGGPVEGEGKYQRALRRLLEREHRLQGGDGPGAGSGLGAGASGGLGGTPDSLEHLAAQSVRRTARRRHLAGLKEDEEIVRLESESDGLYHHNGTITDLTAVAPGNTWRAAKTSLPNCTMCRGCDNSLDMMASGSIMGGSYYAHEPGGSPSWLFRARTNRTASGYAVVKTWCIPVLKVKQRGLAPCSPRKVYAMVKLLLAQQKITDECGFNDIIPKLWVAPVNGVIPGNGFHISWLGLWADVAEGVSIQNYQEFGAPRTKGADVVKMLTSTINSTSIVHGSLFDLLFSQCDRHQQNLFVTDKGKVTLIDNDQVFTTAWRKCGYDSLTIPVAQKFYINQLGFFYVLKYPQADPPKTWNSVQNPLLMLDYRCHAPGGVVGRKFWPKLDQCMNKMRGMTAPQIKEAYGYPNLRMADAIRNRSRDLLEHGFEWTLLHGEPTNQPMHRYKVPQKCCNMTFSQAHNKYSCNTPWKPMLQIPFGNAWHGGKWHGTPGRDTGTFEGGTSFI